MSNGGFSNSGGGFNGYQPMNYGYRPPMASGFNGGGYGGAMGNAMRQNADGSFSRVPLGGGFNGYGGNWAGGSPGFNFRPPSGGYNGSGFSNDGPAYATNGAPGNMGGNVQPNDGIGTGFAPGGQFGGQNADPFRRSRMGMVQSAISPQQGNDPQAGMGGIGGLFSPGYSLRGY